MTVDLRPIVWPVGKLAERRAIFVYEVTRLQAEAARAPIVPEPWSAREETFKTQFMELIERHCSGKETFEDAEAAHDSWWQAYIELGWVYGPERDPVKKTHPDMVPFAELGWRERIKDAVFVALLEMARKWVVDEDPGEEMWGGRTTPPAVVPVDELLGYFGDCPIYESDVPKGDA